MLEFVQSSKTENDKAIFLMVKEWMTHQLGCQFGRREYLKNRYLVALVENSEEFVTANNYFKKNLKALKVSSCLYVYRNVKEGQSIKSVTEVTAFMRDRLVGKLMSEDSEQFLTQRIKVSCPVTKTSIEFCDFDLVGFYPQATSESDPLYDPSNHSPFVCINQTSDIYGFSLYIREMMDRARISEINEIVDKDYFNHLLDTTRKAWNRMATQTINSFGKNTNKDHLCPAHVSTDGQYYLTQHDEAEFAETIKRGHISEMPLVYLQRLIEEWRRYCTTGVPPNLIHVVRPAICPAKISSEYRI